VAGKVGGKQLPKVMG